MMSMDESLEFLLKDFEQCFANMRHYDSMQLSLVKFAFSFYSAVATITFALSQYFYETPLVKAFLGGLLFLVFFIAFMIIVMLVRYRVSFVYVSRQVNSIRKTFLDLLDSNKITFWNFCLARIDRPQLYYTRSAHFILIFLLSLINSITLVFAGFFILQYLESSSLYFYVVMPLLFAISFSLEVFYVRKELRRRLFPTRFGGKPEEKPKKK